LSLVHPPKLGLRLRALALAAIAAAGLWQAAPAAAQDTPVAGGTLTIALPTEPQHLNSAMDTTQHVKMVAGKIFSGLIRYDRDMNMSPDLAESWSVAEDGLSITFNLRQGVKWHDGTPFTSKDVAYSVLRGFGQNNGLVRAVFSNVADVETPDDHTAILRLKAPTPAIMMALPVATATILPAHIYDNGGNIRENPANQAPIGTGPFRFVEWQRGSSIVLERNPDYFEDGRPYLDRIVFAIIPDTQSRGAAVEAGQIDMVYHSTAAASDARRLGDLPHLELSTEGYFFESTVCFWEFNMDHPILGKPEVRRALAHVIDKQFILDNVWMGFGATASSPFHRNLAHAHTDAVPTYAYDPATAERLLDEAGYPRGSDGVRFRMTIDYTPFGDHYQRMAQYARQQLAAIGVETDVRSQDFASWVRRIWTDRDWDTNMSAITNASDPTIGIQRAYWSQNIRPGTPFTNGTHYSNPTLDALFEAAAQENDAEKRRAQFAEVQTILATDLPVIALVAIDQFTVANTRVRGYDALADGVYSGFAHVWLADQ
jgi:peptide/nickel transport system substrate-binding protein